jgi:hypothetical protein
VRSGGQAGLSTPVTRLNRLIVLSGSVAFIGCAVAACSSSRDESSTLSAVDSLRADSTARAQQDSINRTLPGYVVDSILPAEEELRRFRLAVAAGEDAGAANEPRDSATTLAGGARSREGLVRRFMTALSANDSSAFSEMLLTAREFADLVYPESPYTHPPYRQSPALVWNQIRNPSTSGLTRLLRRIGGTRIHYMSHFCDRRPDRQGANVIWAGCTVRIVDQNRDTTSQRLFGSIIERDGQFKFVSYSNEF